MKNTVSSDFLEVLLALKSNIFRDLKVASLGQVESIDINNNTLRVKLIPKTESESDYKNVTVFCLHDIENNINVGDIIVVLFLDKNFISNLNRVKSNKQLVDIPKGNLHNELYGIAIKTF